MAQQSELPRWVCTVGLAVLTPLALLAMLVIWVGSPRFRAYMRNQSRP